MAELQMSVRSNSVWRLVVRISAAIDANCSIGASGIGASNGITTLVVSGSTGSRSSSDKWKRPVSVLSSSVSHSALAWTSSFHSRRRCAADESSIDEVFGGRAACTDDDTFSDTMRCRL